LPAMAVYQCPLCQLTHRHRRQASSHIDSAHCLFATFPTYRRALQPAHFGR